MDAHPLLHARIGHAEASLAGGAGDRGHAAHRLQERGRRGRSAAVVGKQQEIRAKVGARSNQGELRVHGEIARQQYPAASCRDPQHQRGVVASPARVRRRPQALHAQALQIQRRPTRSALHDGHAALAGGGQHRREAGRVPTAAGQPQPSHRQAAQDGGRATAVIEIGVSQGEQVEALYTQRRQRGQHGVASPVAAGEGAAGIDQDRRGRALDQHRVALPHIQEHDPRRRRDLRPRRREREHQTRERRAGQPYAGSG
jgi:hypothetical protein